MMGYGLPSKEPSLAPLSQHSSNVKPSSQGCNHAVQKSSNESLENFGSGDGMRTQRSVTSSTKLPTTTKSSRRARIKVWRKSRRCFRRKSWWPELIESRFPNSLGTREKVRELAKEELTAAKRSLVMRVLMSDTATSRTQVRPV